MIIYGYKGTVIKSELLPHEKCPFCEKEGAMTMNIVSSHAHVFWIPFFPYNKSGIAHCGECGKTIEKKVMSESLKREYNTIKGDAKHPIWKFTGLFIVGAIIVITSITSSQAKAAEKEAEAKWGEYAKAPQRGDLYKVKGEKGYSLIRVLDVKDTTVMISFNEFELQYEGKGVQPSMKTIKKELEEMDLDGNYHDTDYITVEVVESLYNDGTIIEVVRK